MRFRVNNTFRSFDFDEMGQEDVVGADADLFYGNIRSVGTQEAATIECLNLLNSMQGLDNIDEITIGSLSRQEAIVSGIKSEDNAKSLKEEIENSETSFIQSVDVEDTTTGDRWRLILTPK